MLQMRNTVCEKCVLFTQIDGDLSIKFLNLKQGDTLLLLCAQNLKMQLHILKYTFSSSPGHRNIIETSSEQKKKD